MISKLRFLSLAVACAGLALAAPTARAAGIHLQFAALPPMIAPHDTFTVNVSVSPGDAEFNAFDLNIAYDPTHLVFVPTAPVADQRGTLMTGACANTFHLFTPTSGVLQVTLSLLCNGVFVTGPGVIYSVRFAATDSVGPTTIQCAAGSQFYRAGFFVNPLDCQPLMVSVSGISAAPEKGDPTEMLLLATPITGARSVSGESTRIAFTLPRADTATLELFDVRGRRLAEYPAASYPRGRTELDWHLPPLASGTYFVRLATGAGLTARKSWVLVR